MHRTLLPVLTCICIAGAAAAEQAPSPSDLVSDLPERISLTNALDPALRKAIADGDAAEVVALGGTARQALAAVMTGPRPGGFASLAEYATQSAGGQVVYASFEGQSGLALLENDRVRYAAFASDNLLGYPVAGARMVTEAEGLSRGRTLLGMPNSDGGELTIVLTTVLSAPDTPTLPRRLPYVPGVRLIDASE